MTLYYPKKLLHIHETIVEIFAITGFSEILTIAESMEAEQRCETKSAGLMNRLKKYRDKYIASCQYAAAQGIGMDAIGSSNW